MKITPPIRVSLIDINGNLSREWVLFFNQVAKILNEGDSGVFTTADAKTVTVTQGIVSDIT